MSRHILISTFLAMVAAMALVATTSAGLISGGNAELSANGSEIGVSDALAVVWAWNANGSTAATVNGISFQTAKPAGITLPSYGYSRTNNTPTMDYYSGTDMKNLMGWLHATEPNGTDVLATISGLTVGEEYVVQFLHHQGDQNNQYREGLVRFGGSAAGTPLGGTMVHGGGENDPFSELLYDGTGQGYITTARFIADATSQPFFFDVDSGNDRIVLNAAALYLIPEPSALMLLAAGVIGLLACGRRGRK